MRGDAWGHKTEKIGIWVIGYSSGHLGNLLAHITFMKPRELHLTGVADSEVGVGV